MYGHNPRETTHRKHGRPKLLPDTRPYTVRLPPDLGDWAKYQPEGLSAMVRQLLIREYGRRQSGQPRTPTPAREPTLF
jgi:hypothetical protein